MRITTDVDLPDKLLAAQRAGELVVFAGAGVSMGPPSRLPSFEELAERVVGGAIEREGEEDLDRFLGRAADEGVDIESRTRDIIGNEQSSPTKLHEDLARLFADQDKVRLITTNFDRHFSTVLDNLFGGTVETYFAPALPLGKEFAGLAYIHGSVLKPRHGLVLSDSDFGRAYLSDGWATRMLVEVFQQFVVLFVGYSHDDPIMHYVARSLVPKTERFALIVPGDDDRWQRLGVTPVHFPPQSEQDRYGALNDAIAAWALYVRMGVLERGHRTRDLVGGSPPLGADLNDFLAQVIGDDADVRFFVDHASTVEWLNWIEERKPFLALFRREPLEGMASRALARWFCQRFVIDHPAEAMAVVQRRGPTMNPELWNEIALSLAAREPCPEPQLIRLWVLVLLSAAMEWPSAHGLQRLISRLNRPEDIDSALMLLAHLARPISTVTRPRSELSDGSPGVWVDIEALGRHDCLDRVWNELLSKQLEGTWVELKTMLVGHILEARLLLRASGETSFDALSYRRSAIEPHPQDKFRNDFDFLIDSTRDVLEFLVKEHPDVATSTVNEWLLSDSLILRRLAIHGLSEDSKLEPNFALAMVCDRAWLYDSYLRHEVFRLIGSAYPKASDEARERLIKYSVAADVVQSGSDDESVRDISNYERYNVAVWLTRNAPDCPLARRHFEAVQKEFPDFRPRENPDLSHWSGGAKWVHSKSPMTADELLAVAPAEQLEFLTGFEGRPADFEGPSRAGLMTAVKGAAQSSFEWGFSLAELLRTHGEWDPLLWGALFDAWREAELEESQWRLVLQFTTDEYQSLRSATSRSIEDFLEKAVTEVPSDLVERIEALTDVIVGAAEQAEPADSEDVEDWLSAAINNQFGRISLIWLKALSRRYDEGREKWDGLPEAYRSRFEAAIGEDSVVGHYVRPVLGGNVQFLYELDAQWTQEALIPLFDWSGAAWSAPQVWHGFAHWGRPSNALLSLLMPALKSTFSRFDDACGQAKHDFVSKLVGAAVYSAIDPWHDGWLVEFAAHADPDARHMFASIVATELTGLSDDASETAWSRWIKDYWSDRNTGVPQPLDDNERAEMVGWVLGLRPVLSDAVQKVRVARVRLPEHHLFFYRISRTELASTHPVDIAKLVRHVLDDLRAPFYECSELDSTVRDLISNGAQSDDLTAICDHMARLGCPSSEELSTLVGAR